MKPTNSTSAETEAAIVQANQEAARPPWKKWLFRLLRILILSAVVVGIGMFVRNAIDEFRSESFDVTKIRWPWLLFALASYSLGMIPFWLFWHRVLYAFGQRPTYRESARAYFIGHLGKYVPGKAMVVVLRASMVKSNRTQATVAGLAVFVETLSMMAVGACVASACLLPSIAKYPHLVLLALGLMLVAGLPTAPPLFRRVIRILRVRRLNADVDEQLKGLTWRTMGFGWLIMTVGWIGYGLSLYGTLRAMPGVEPSLADIPRLIGSVSLAMVAGFISLIPAGMGVRELVMLPLLSSFGNAKAVVAVVLVRVVWLMSEVGVSSILYMLGNRSETTSNPTSSPDQFAGSDPTNFTPTVSTEESTTKVESQ